jgi:hypothetical protein
LFVLFFITSNSIKSATVSHVARTRCRSRAEEILRESYSRRTKQQMAALDEKLARVIQEMKGSGRASMVVTLDAGGDGKVLQKALTEIKKVSYHHHFSLQQVL